MRYLGGLRDARERAFLTQEELAARSGITAAAISRLENGLQAGRISTIRKIAAALDVPAETLVDWERPVPRPTRTTRAPGKAAA